MTVLGAHPIPSRCEIRTQWRDKNVKATLLSDDLIDTLEQLRSMKLPGALSFRQESERARTERIPQRVLAYSQE
jgi:hypothetical protein